MLTQEQVVTIIQTERQYQEATWPSHEGHAHSEHALILLEIYLEEMRKAWKTSQNEVPVVKVLAKIAAIAVRGLERIDGSEVLLSEPLR